MPPLLLAYGLHKSYVAGYGHCWARVHVLASLTLSLDAGERVLVLGERASGKSTLLHCLVGLRRLDAGVVRWNAIRGAPYRLCREPDDVGDAGRHCAALVELPGHGSAMCPWIDALLARQPASASWLVLASAAPALERVAHRILELRDGTLHSATPVAPGGRRVAERGAGSPAARDGLPVTTRIPD